nr:venom protein [Lampona murina]
MKMKYTLFIVLCFAIYVFADEDEEMKQLEKAIKAIEVETGKKAMVFFEQRNGKQNIMVLLCDDENDCKAKRRHLLQHQFLRFG